LTNSSTIGARPREAAATTAARTPSPLTVSDSTIHRLSDVFRLLADKSRLKMILALAQEGEMHVSSLCGLLGQSQPAVSHHLTLMRMVGLVDFHRRGKHNFYYIASRHVRDLLEQFFADSGNGHKQLRFEEFVLTYESM